jgi:hypothetical protein
MKKDIILDENIKFDTRVTEHGIRDGHLDPKELERHLKSLPDESAKVTYIEVFEEKPPEEDELTFTSV